MFCGRQSPGGHNIITGLFDALKKHNSESTLIGFIGEWFPLLGVWSPRWLRVGVRSPRGLKGVRSPSSPCMLLVTRQSQLSLSWVGKTPDSFLSILRLSTKQWQILKKAAISLQTFTCCMLEQTHLLFLRTHRMQSVSNWTLVDSVMLS